MSSLVEVRRELRPGDREAIVRQHGVLYRAEYDLSPNMERHVQEGVARATQRGWPDSSGAVWIVEHDGAFAGSLALTDEGDAEAALRWFLLDPAVRGRGLGDRLVGELVAEAEREGYRRIWFETLGILTTAARIYRRHGFCVVHEQMGAPWGDSEIPYQRYELILPRRRDRRGEGALAGSA
jgi:ribosomal protein S18 acetylase RimI-like enzyme